jgi:hypothetical protein
METIPPPEVEPQVVPQRHVGRHYMHVPEYPHALLTLGDFEDYERNINLQELYVNSPSAAHKLAYKLIHHCRLSPIVFEQLRKKYLKSFSKVTWKDVVEYFRPNLAGPFEDHRSIPPYALQRARIPLPIFKDICSQLDASRMTLGRRENLESESAVQLKYNPIPSTLLTLFGGRLVNIPEHKLVGQLGSSGRCEFTISFHSLLVLCFIEYKQGLRHGGVGLHSDIVAQVIAEMDGADTHNQSEEMDGICIQAILTDGVIFEFYTGNFKHWTMHRGVGYVEEGIPYDGDHRIALPESEKAVDYLAKLKVVVEIIFNTFLIAYINGVAAKKARSERHQRVWENQLGRGFLRRNSNSFWDFAEAKALEAHSTLLAANRLRLVDPHEADRQAEFGLEQLNQSVLSIPTPDLDWSFLDNWDQRAEALMRV